MHAHYGAKNLEKVRRSVRVELQSGYIFAILLWYTMSFDTLCVPGVKNQLMETFSKFFQFVRFNVKNFCSAKQIQYVCPGGDHAPII